MDQTTFRMLLASFLQEPDNGLIASVQTALRQRLTARDATGMLQPCTEGGMAYWCAKIRTWARARQEGRGAMFLAVLDKQQGERATSPGTLNARSVWMASRVVVTERE